MKDFKFLFGVLVFVLSSLTIKATAATDPGSNVIVRITQEKATSSFTIQLANLQKEEVVLTVFDDDDVALNERKVADSNGLRLKYILKDFEDGVYTLKMAFKDQEKNWRIFKIDDRLEFQLLEDKKDEGTWLLRL